ncbi:MAG TPA: ribulose-phosphate 3-epimerase [Candidatus Omnitrophota bacterium]|nr:ribulose-phosphate 3-epimerase [Candidatus Omnitrophota bacterium]
MDRSSVQVSASILCADFSRLNEEIEKTQDAGCDFLHVDVMDGHFVPNITIGQVMVKAMRPLTKLPIEAHLMIEHPTYYIDSFVDAGADIISIHAECYGPRRKNCQKWEEFPKEVDTIDVASLREAILKIKKRGKKAFVTLNPGTPLCIEPLLKDIDGVLIMSVNPGFAGQKFMPEVLGKIKELRKTFGGDIEIDGGINEATAPAAVEAGANILVTASYFFGAKNPLESVRRLRHSEER